MVTQKLTLFREQIFQDFDDSSAFQDDVHEQVFLNTLEREVVDSPEFQRLFRLGQLGFVDLVYHTANHTRGAHCIGTCAVSKRLIDSLNRNNAKFASLRKEHGADETEIPRISKFERVLISLGALLHDVSHGPFSHDIEKKTHNFLLGGKRVKVKSHYGPFEKHDNYRTNPALYVFLMDTRVSVLARILRSYSRDFYQLLAAEARHYSHLSSFFELTKKWRTAEQDLLPSLLFHLLVFEKLEESAQCEIAVRTSFESEDVAAWGLGPKNLWSDLHQAWYQPFRHDIIGNTLSADLIDYLLRDQQRLGKSRSPDWKMLDFYTLAPQSFRYDGVAEESVVFRTALDLNDYKRGTVRAERINDIFRLLDLRHEIHEKAVYHRIVQSAIAMMSRAALILKERKPPIRSLYGLDGTSPALAGDDHFMTLMTNAAAEDCQAGDEVSALRTIPWKLAERRVYRPLMLISGDRVPKLLSGVCDMEERLAPTLRELAAVVDSTYYSSFFLFLSWSIESLLQHSIDGDDGLDSYIDEIIKDEKLLRTGAEVIPKRVVFWTNPYKQLYKDPALLVRVKNQLVTLENLPDNEAISKPFQDRVAAGILDAETKNEGLWKFYVFLSDGLFYTGSLSKLLPEHACNIVPNAHVNCLRSAQNIVIRGIRTAWEDWEANRRTAAVDLSKPASLEDFRQLLTVFRSERLKYERNNSRLLDEVSEVAVEEYLHGEDLEKCRDVRYKHDISTNVQEAVNKIKTSDETRELVFEIAELLRVSEKQLASQETQEFLTRLARRIEKDNEFEMAISRDIQQAEKEAARGRLPIHPKRLRALYLGDLTPASVLRDKTNV